MTDVKKPEVVKNPFSEKVITILSKQKDFQFYKSISGIEGNLYLESQI